jgi:arginase family enzyme
LDAFDESEVAVFMPEPDGLAVSEVEELLLSVRERKPVLGAGLTAMLPREENLEPISRLTAALGF